MNPTPVNSSNIANFGFSSKFKLSDKQIIFDLTGYSTFVGDGAANVQGVFFKVIDPTGILLKDIDFDNPDIAPGDSQYTLQVPSGLFMFGWWQLTGIIVDQDGKQTAINIKKEICDPGGLVNGVKPGILKALVNCNAPSIKINENTNLIYNGAAPVSLEKAGDFFYPQGTLDPLEFTSTPMLISGSSSVYTGDYKVDLTTTALYDLKDGVQVEIKYFTSIKFTVSCNSGLASIICCMTATQDIYNQWPNSEKGRAAKAQLDQIAPYVYMALSLEKLGMPSDKEIEKIAEILGCDCKCGAQLIEPVPVGQEQNIVIAAGCGMDVEVDSEGNTTTFTLSGQVTVVAKDNENDLSFNIVPTQSGCTTLYAISFNYPELAETLLITIKEDDNLASLLNAIIDRTLFADSMAGLDGKCIVDLTKVDFNLTVGISQTGVQTVNNIVIDTVTFNAPGGLALINNAGIASWLNGLGKGAFTVVKDLTAQTVTIASLQNTHKISTLSLTNVVDGTSNIKIYLFSSTTKNIPDLLQALFDYICALDGSDVLFGVDALQQYSFNSDASAILKTTISRTDTLNTVISNIIKAQQQLFNQLFNTGLSCINIKKLFVTVDKTLVSTDGILGTKGGVCALVPYSELAKIILQQVQAGTDLQGMLCALTQACTGAVCAPPTNVSAVFTSGTLTVSANDVAADATPVQIRYRINNSGLSFTQVNATGADLPKAIGAGALAAGQYEVQIRIQCSNGAFSAWIATVTNNACLAPAAFTVGTAGSNFVINGTLNSGQTIIEVLMTDPNGGQTTTIHDFGAVSGTFNIPIPSTLGDYTFQARAVCNNTSTPRFVSNFLAPITVSVGSAPVDNLYAWAGYGLALEITNGTSTGIPGSFASPPITFNRTAYVPVITAGTILVTPSGSLGPPTAHYKLVKNSTTVLDSQPVSGLSAVTLTLPADVNAPDVLSIEIDTP